MAAAGARSLTLCALGQGALLFLWDMDTTNTIADDRNPISEAQLAICLLRVPAGRTRVLICASVAPTRDPSKACNVHPYCLSWFDGQDGNGQCRGHFPSSEDPLYVSETAEACRESQYGAL